MREILRALGFSDYESRAIEFLLRRGRGSGPEISKETGIPITRVYDVMGKLVKLGLAQEIPERPKKYVVGSPVEFFQKLFTEKKQELETLQKELFKQLSRLSPASSSKDEPRNEVRKVKNFSQYAVFIRRIVEKHGGLVGGKLVLRIKNCKKSAIMSDIAIVQDTAFIPLKQTKDGYYFVVLKDKDVVEALRRYMESYLL